MFGFRVGSIRSHLTADRLFPVNQRAIMGPPKMSLMFEAKSMLPSIIKPRFILVAHTDDHGWYITSNQQGQMFVQNLNRIVSKPYVMPGQIPCYITDCIPIDLMLQENFPSNTQFGTACAIKMTADREEWSELPTTATHTRSGISVIMRSSVPPPAWVRLKTNWSQPCRGVKSKAATP